MIGANTVLNERYRLVSVLAKGGMGVIWRGWDKRSQNVVAIKVLKDELCGQETFLARLRAEACNASRLHHPNLAAVFDWGETEGQGWIVMELVEGRPLSEILAGGHTLTWNELAPILVQIAGGLQASHEKHVIHRDVKPSNILISDKGVAKLTDFGISLAPRAEALTAVGMVMGTAQYLPPEQAMGHTATASGDIYALGIIAYEALAGKRPFTGATQVDIALAHVKKPVPPLPDTIAPEVAKLVYDMLEKDPAKRPASAAEVQQRIRLLWHGEIPPAFTPRMSFSRNATLQPSTQQIPQIHTTTQAPPSTTTSPHLAGTPASPALPAPSGGADTGTPLDAPLAKTTTTAPQNRRHASNRNATRGQKPNVIPVSSPPSPGSRNSLASHRLSPHTQRKHLEARKKIIAAIIIMAAVALTLIIGLITSIHQTSAASSLNCHEAHEQVLDHTRTVTQEDYLDPVG